MVERRVSRKDDPALQTSAEEFDACYNHERVHEGADGRTSIKGPGRLEIRDWDQCRNLACRVCHLGTADGEYRGQGTTARAPIALHHSQGLDSPCRGHP